MGGCPDTTVNLYSLAAPTTGIAATMADMIMAIAKTLIAFIYTPLFAQFFLVEQVKHLSDRPHRPRYIPVTSNDVSCPGMIKPGSSLVAIVLSLATLS